MASEFPRDDQPAFSSTVYNIMDRYRSGIVELHTASRALSAITMALAPDNLLDGGADAKLNRFFTAKLELYREGMDAETVKTDVVQAIMAAAESDWAVLGRFGLGR